MTAVVYRATVKRLTGGDYYARCLAAPNGLAEGQGRTAELALLQLRREIRFQMEYCPCSGVARDAIELQVVER